MAKAVKKIKKGIHRNKRDAESWIVWGIILETVGKYDSAKHKFEKALKYDKTSFTAMFELVKLMKVVELDSQIPMNRVRSPPKI